MQAPRWGAILAANHQMLNGTATLIAMCSFGRWEGARRQGFRPGGLGVGQEAVGLRGSGVGLRDFGAGLRDCGAGLRVSARL